MPIYRSSPKRRSPVADTPQATVQRLQFRHRFDRDEVVDVIEHVELSDTTAPRRLDRNALRASRAALAGYRFCCAVTAAPRQPTWSHGA
jgi:hypothetical protein